MSWSYLYWGQNVARNSPSWTKGNTNQWRYNMSGVPFVGDWIRAADQNQWRQDYMDNYGVGWEDVKYPSMVPGAGSYAHASTNLIAGSGIVSKNLLGLYRSGRPYKAVPRGGRSVYNR
ncbi:hypothetical protein [Camel associated drosmacovirus 1]|uniref:Uncharacterized protein n=1 Tax=Camel associated drosmacovirus 1 TaxID=2169876 RepID=A0A0A1EKU7_9VIRU|nr:hypothetical protein [Camel associated drosmacovirus 1]AIY31244.1 hypothetical protein [Camel associated drosmacovirus 1]